MDDERIIKMFFNRDENAISQTAEKYGAYCKKIALNILSAEEDAEECVNTVYMKVWQKIPPEKPDIFPAFLAKLTRNAAIDSYRGNKRIKRGAKLISQELSECLSDKETPENAAEHKELVRTINKFLGGLSKKKRKLFVSRYCYCESLSELSFGFGITEDNAAVILCRIRKQLKEYLKKEGFEI